ncbi:LIM zinc-binding domain-containing Nebulette-like [Clytia hemisphaerica]|uniref:LIM zinc-binding domain-containing protein n=1 Tax=Clytia hemisphaerica TaxID=252671 RepID=A0A7M5WY10_9CNID|eukprot:TCONS_00016926-protein
MNPKCHRCQKTVYPVEKMLCLDKAWHKGCFNCEVCHMKLSMKTYKGYNKLPYCGPHYPTTKHTTVAETPEQLRLKEATSNQSGLVYQKNHQENLSKFTTVSDDPETLRNKKIQAQTSGLVYQKDHQENLAKFTAVSDDPETVRNKKMQAQQSQAVYQKNHQEELGKFTAVTDDPELVRNRKMQEQASTIAYKGTAPPGSREADGFVPDLESQQ